MVVVDEMLAEQAELAVIPETESYVSGKMQSWATRDVANKKAELAEEELEVERRARLAVEGEREVLQRFGAASVVQSVQSELKAKERETLLLRDVNQARVERQRAELKAKESELKALRSGNDALEIGERYTAVTGC
jgi:hypothetical protein